MPDDSHIDMLGFGCELWNIWRSENPNEDPFLNDSHLFKRNFRGMNLSRADFSYALLEATCFQNANLIESNFNDSDLTDANFIEAYLRKAKFQGSQCSNACFTGADMQSAIFRDATLIDVEFDEANISNTDFSSADLRNGKFRNANLRNSKLIGVDLSDAILSGAILCGADLHQSHLSDANLQNANLTGANLNGASLVGANLRASHLTDANLQKANLTGANLNGASLVGADLHASRLIDANLQNANLTGANLNGVNLIRANLKGANLTGATLSRVNLEMAECSGANFSMANLCDSRLSNVNFTRANLSNAWLWETQRAGWIIKDVICDSISLDEDRKQIDTFYPGDFERYFSTSAKVRIKYPDGISELEIITLPTLIRHLEKSHPGAKLRLDSIENSSTGSIATIVFENDGDISSEQLKGLKSAVEKDVRKNSQLLRQSLEQRKESEGLLKDEVRYLRSVLESVVVKALSPNNSYIFLEKGDYVMNDKYKINQAAAVGPFSHAHDVTLNQIGSHIESTMNLTQLAEELSVLRQAMKQEATEPTHDEAVGEVAKAENAARVGESSKLAESLKAAGKFSLDVATKIGVSLASEAIKHSMGMS
jgi:uncharacterized protein YjbI with pentapeptide repeats